MSSSRTSRGLLLLFVLEALTVAGVAPVEAKDQHNGAREGGQVIELEEDETPPVALTRFTWVETAQKLDELDVLEVCIDNTTKYEDLNSPIVLTYSAISSNIEYSIDGNGIYKENKLCEQFHVDITTLDFNGSQTYMLNSDKWNGIETFTLTMGPGEYFVDYLNELKLDRISGDFNFTATPECLNEGADLCFCYMKELSGEVCVTPVDSETVVVCDATKADTTPVDHVTSINSVELSYDEGSINITPASSIYILEVLIQTPDDLFAICTDSTCMLDDFKPGEETSYLVTVVELENNRAQSSKRLEVFDLAVTSRALSHDTIEVSWKDNEDIDDELTISITSSIDNKPYASIIGPCVYGSLEICRQYFIKLDLKLLQNYTVNANYSFDDNYSILTTVPLSLDEIDEENYRITNLVHTTNDGSSTIETRVCSEISKTDGATVLVIDSKGAWVNGTGIEDAEQEDTTCFDALALNTELLATDELMRFMFYFEDTQNLPHIVSYQVDVFIFKTSFDQVGNTTARATWKNLNNDGYYYSLHSPQLVEEGSRNEPVPMYCSVIADACHYYVDEDGEGSKQFSLNELSTEVNQTSTVKFEKLETLPDLTVYETFPTRYDGRLLVCFEPEAKAVRYELGVELYGYLLASDQDAAIDQYEGHSCAVTSDKPELGAYVTLWAVVVAYMPNGSIIASGEQSYENVYLKPDRNVMVVIDEDVMGTFTLQSSWSIVDSTEGLDKYEVHLVNEAADIIEENYVDITSCNFRNKPEGLYSVCVKVRVTGTTIFSEETCSDVVRVELMAGPPIPEIELGELLHTSDNEVKVTWETPEGITAILVSWNEHSSQKELRSTGISTSSSSRKRLLSIDNKKLGSPLETSRVLERMHNTRTEEKLQYMIVPSTQSSVDLPLETGSWDICLSSIVNNNAGEANCDNLVDVADTVDPPSPPTNLQYDSDSGMLSWDAADEVGIVSYFIEWTFGPFSKSKTIEGATEMNLMDIAGPGEWRITAKTINNQNYISIPTLPLNVIINGISYSYKQTALHEISISWEEVDKMNDPPNTYAVATSSAEKAKDNINLDAFQCQQPDCMVVFTDVTATKESPMNVTIKNIDIHSANVMVTFKVYCQEIPDVTSLTRTSPESTSVTWDCVEGAEKYNVSLYNASMSVIWHDFQPVPCSYDFTMEGENFEDDVVGVQACLSKDRYDRCGNSRSIDFRPPDSSESSSVLLIVLLSVGGGLLLIVLVGTLIYYLVNDKKNKPQNAREILEDDDVSRSAGENISNVAEDEISFRPGVGGAYKNPAMDHPPSMNNINSLTIDHPPPLHDRNSPIMDRPPPLHDRNSPIMDRPPPLPNHDGPIMDRPPPLHIRNNHAMDSQPPMRVASPMRTSDFNNRSPAGEGYFNQQVSSLPRTRVAAEDKTFRPPTRPTTSDSQRGFNQYPPVPPKPQFIPKAKFNQQPRNEFGNQYPGPPARQINRRDVSPMRKMSPRQGRRNAPPGRSKSRSPVRRPQREIYDMPTPKSWMPQGIQPIPHISPGGYDDREPRVTRGDEYGDRRTRRNPSPRRSRSARRRPPTRPVRRTRSSYQEHLM